MAVVNKPVGAGLVAGEATGVIVATRLTVLKPGGRLPVHWNADAEKGPAVPNGSPAPQTALTNVHPVGAMNVALVIG
jgi:hypothetical protein